MSEEPKKQNSDVAATGRTEVFKIPDTAETVKLEPDTIIRLHKLAFLLERMNLTDYLTYMRKPHRVFWINFIAGLSRGLGFAIGMTILFGFVLYLFGKMVDIPLIGKYVAKIVAIVQEEMNLNR